MSKLQDTERIESLRRAILNKKSSLGINTDILYLKSLRKFNNLEEVKYPKSISNDYMIFSQVDIKERFSNVSTIHYQDSYKYNYVFKKIVDEITKNVYSELSSSIENCSETESIDIIMSYISNNTKISALKLSSINTETEKEFCIAVMKEREKSNSTKILQFSNEKYESKYELYAPYDISVKKTAGMPYVGKNRFRGISGRIINIFQIIATSIVLESVNNYFFNNVDNFNYMREKLSEKLNVEDSFFDEISSELFFDIFEENNYSLPMFLKTIIVLAMEEMLREAFDIYQYEERLKSMSGDYARTYMTKKNIPKKILNFMDNNNFLNMFGFVEADADCELEKLNILSNEFKELSTKLFLPKVENHSLRFRKLGKLKALGVYYPGHNTLAVDLDGVSSFIHEMFHMIDFSNDILSLDSKFKPLLDKYRLLMDLEVEKLGPEHATYKAWFSSKSKYSRAYYRANEEAFARMGEIYVTDILKINSSFSKTQYNEIHYPKDETLLELIKNYYDELFIIIKNKFEPVVFKDNNVTNYLNNNENNQNNNDKIKAVFNKDIISEELSDIAQLSFF